MMTTPLENGAELWLVVRGTPTEGFKYSGPYESQDAAQFGLVEWREDGDGYGEWVLETDTWVVPMQYRKGYHTGALQVGV